MSGDGDEGGGGRGGVGGGYDYAGFSELAGVVGEVPVGVYRVGFRRLREGGGVGGLLFLVCGAPLVALVLLVWLLWPVHWVVRGGWLGWVDGLMLVSVGLVEVFRVVNVVSVAHASWVARDPVPVRVQPGWRVAFCTSFVPGKEPLSMVEATLVGAVGVGYEGVVDVWLLDEGDDPGARALCARLGVRHFSRKGVARWNRPSGRFRARTKHGNYNAWLDAHGDGYDFLACVDTDHVPLPNFLERMLGYFRDPDVAFVVGPQVYGNYVSGVTKGAESQQFLFHALVQRAGNRYGSAMFVGTSNCVRISVLRQIGGLFDSITEDMATGLEIHRRRNPVTGGRWRSVYTPDVLAVGEGPSSWTDFFSQQLRWSRGTFETLLCQFGGAVWGLSWGRLWNYGLLVAYYPLAALTWVLGGVSCVLFLVLGAAGLGVSWPVWLMLYGDALVLQVVLYVVNRRHNVSPHEPVGSSGVAGMVMSAVSAPLYARALGQALLRRRSGFVVTPKGGAVSGDCVGTFRTHVGWAGVFGGCLVGSVVWGHDFVVMRVWALLALVTALGPLCFWWVGRRRDGGDGGGVSVVAPGGSESAGVTGRVGERSPA
ncbi:cellulose synthase catalytic subunit [Streptomyces sp. NPDC051173]|uniref:glycosyltransferase family 2 protein n=1 Tax=Streptomyces sp. NPDC051173 TaxID=3155164 RepID=UPI00344CF2E7